MHKMKLQMGIRTVAHYYSIAMKINYTHTRSDTDNIFRVRRMSENTSEKSRSDCNTLEIISDNHSINILKITYSCMHS